MVHFDEKRSAFTPYGFTCEVWEPQAMSRPDRHDEIEINFVDRGTLTYLMGAQLLTVEPRTFTIFWAAIPHQIVAFQDVTFYYVATIPFARFLQWNIPSELRTRVIMGDVVSERPAGRVVDDLAMFKQWSQDLAQPGHALDEIVQLELMARILRMASSMQGALPAERSESSAGAAHLGKAEMMASFVARHYTSRIQIRDIAEDVDLHPDYASTLFRKTFGTTLNGLITRHRITHAQRQLLTTDERIVSIAHAAGFDTLSRFNRAFRQVTGVTPRQYRKQNKFLEIQVR